MTAQGKTIGELASTAGVGSSYYTRLVKLSFLAPEVIQAILHGHQPFELNAKRLARHTGLPTDWLEQKAMLGIA